MTTLGLWGACAAALSGPIAPMRSAPVEPALCALIGADVAGRYALQAPAVGLWRGFQLPRAHLELGLDFAGVGAARFELAVVRSGGETGYIGVAGESLLPRLQVAEARFQWRQVGLRGAAGLLEDPWIREANLSWTYRPAVASFAQESGWFDRSDLGASLGWALPLRFAEVEVMVHTGEGLARRERNLGVDTTAVVQLRPLSLLGEPGWLEVALLARDGSRGLGSARDHRGAFRVVGRPGPVDVAVEGLMAFGVQGDAERSPKALVVQAGLRDLGPVRGFARLDLQIEDPAEDATGSARWLVGGGIALPPLGRARPIELLIGYEGAQRGEQAAVIAGAAALLQEHRVWFQVGARLRGAVRLTDLPEVSPAGRPPSDDDRPGEVE